MKKLLLSTALLSAGMAVQAQRLVLYEEFSGENCGPCAAANPTLNALIGANTAKVVLLKYQTPIPSAGPIYYQNVTDVNTRATYYSVPFAPYGRSDGKVLGTGSSPGHVGYFDQAALNAEAALATPFSITATHQWSASGDSIYATVSVTANAAFAPAGASMKLHVALVEHLQYATPPGTNGETDFHNVMRKMYPSAAGTAMPNSWTANQTNTVTIGGPVPSYLDKTAEAFLIVWLQNDNDKIVAQAGKSAQVALTTDVGTYSASLGGKLLCATGTASATPAVSVKNAGTSTLTSATIYYKIDGGAMQTFNWTGSIAGGGTANVNLPAVNLAPGTHSMWDSVVAPNGMADMNLGNSVSTASINVYNATPANLPMSSNLDAATTPANWLLSDFNANGQAWTLVSAANHTTGGSRSLKFNNYAFTPGETEYVILAKPNLVAGPKALDFWVSYAQYQDEDDQLDVVYSTDCGANWTILWSRKGADLKTNPPVGNNTPFVPTQPSQWLPHSVDMSNLSNPNTIVAFRAVSDYGNNLYIDDVAFRTGAPLAVSNTGIANNEVSVFPNPSRGTSRIEFTLNAATDVQITVLDGTGRVVMNLADGRMEQGAHSVPVNASSLAAGLYNIRIQTGTGTTVHRLSVIK